MATDNDTYKPTTAEEKLLQVLLNPESIGKSKTDICAEAEVSRDVYYDAFKKPAFVDYYRALGKDLVVQSVLPVLNACIKEALSGNFQHQKLLLEMAQMHTDELSLTSPPDRPVQISRTYVKPDKS